MYKLFYLCLWMLFVVKESTSIIVIPPSNAAVVQGMVSTSLQCGSNKGPPLQWYNTACMMTPPGTCSPGNAIYDGYYTASLPQRFTLDPPPISNGTVTWNQITINPVLLSDANTYICRDAANAVVATQLIVLGSNPTCAVDKMVAMESEAITFNCSVAFSGSFGPVLQLSSSSIPIHPVNNSTANLVLITLTVNANRSMNGAAINCNAFFDQPRNVTASYVANIPSYTYSVNCTMPQITYCPDNCSLTVAQCMPGTNITCSAQANPPPSFLWLDMDAVNIAATGPVLPGTAIVEGRTYTCVASNNGGTDCSCSASCKVTPTNAATTTTQHAVSSAVAINGAFSSVFFVAAITLAIHFPALLLSCST